MDNVAKNAVIKVEVCMVTNLQEVVYDPFEEGNVDEVASNHVTYDVNDKDLGIKESWD